MRKGWIPLIGFCALLLSFVAVPGAYAITWECDVAAADLVGCYTFDGNVNDGSGTGHDGSVFGSPLPSYGADRNGNTIGAIYLDPQNSQYVEILGLANEAFFPLTISATLAIPNGSCTIYPNYIVQKGIFGFGNFTFYINKDNDNNPYLGYVQRLQSGGNFSFGIGPLWPPPQDFTNVAVTVGEDGGKTYQEGMVVGPGWASSISTPVSNNEPIWIGKGSWDGGESFDYFCGWIDDLRIWKRRLTDLEVSELFIRSLGKSYTLVGAAGNAGIDHYKDEVTVGDAFTSSGTITSVNIPAKRIQYDGIFQFAGSSTSTVRPRFRVYFPAGTHVVGAYEPTNYTNQSDGTITGPNGAAYATIFNNGPGVYEYNTASDWRISYQTTWVEWEVKPERTLPKYVLFDQLPRFAILFGPSVEFIEDTGEFYLEDGKQSQGMIASASGSPPCADLGGDSDGDGACDDSDNCPFDYNPGQEDGDGDGVGDLCDNCPVDANPPVEGVQADVCSADYTGTTDQLTTGIPKPGEAVYLEGCFEFFNSDKEFVFKPTCANTVWEMKDAEGHTLASTGCVNGPAQGIPDDLVPVRDAEGNAIEYCTEPCNLLDRFLPELLTPPSGGTATFQAKAIFTTLIQCPTGVEIPVPVGSAEEDVCPKILMASVESAPVPVTIRNPVTVAIDIKPGTFPNTVNLGTNGNIPVAIFGSAAFHVAEVDPATVKMADASVKVRGKKGGYMTSTEDLNGDGYPDLIVHIDTEGLTISQGDTSVFLSGQTFGGVWFEGTDTVRVVPQ